MSAQLLFAAIVFASLIVEARRATSNERAQRARGGIEPTGDVYKLMRVAYPATFAAMILEGALRGGHVPGTFTAGIAVFVGAKLLKWWAILTLGRFWTFRVLVVPGGGLVARGPYRWLRHPNYVAVMGELVGVALVNGAVLSGVAGTAAFAALIRKRITVEERALRGAAP
ncbi:MAG: putative protein-S-isoprenylcysteine methyltransferase [Acidobacteria bacterium]|nr:putative protein-S-isoprenylcysteine methyltransferase [Acidobacteriota bacterium]